MRSPAPLVFGTPLFSLLLLCGAVLFATPARAAGCDRAATLSTCFDANSLWIPAGHSWFSILPDTRSSDVGRVVMGVAAELLRHPVRLHAASPDAGGRDIQVLDYAFDASYFLAIGLMRRLELTLAAPGRVYQTGSGTEGISTQSGPPLTRNAIRNPRLGLGYSLNDSLGARGLGLRLAFEASFPVAAGDPFAGERSIVAMPSSTLSWHLAALRVTGSLGARFRKGLEFGGVRLQNQGFVALGVGVELIAPELLFVSVEAFALPPLGSSRASTANAQVNDARLFPAEWLVSVHSSLGTEGLCTLSLAAGSGIPLSSETRETSGGPSTSHFLGLTTPDFRSLLALRFGPAPEPVAQH